MKRLMAAIVLVLCATGTGQLAAQEPPLNVVATTTIIADVAANVGGDLVNVTALIPADSDVHAFEPRPEDVAAVATADVLLVNGAGLEAFLERLLDNAGGVRPTVVSTGVEMLPLGEHGYDEHEDEATTGDAGHEDEEGHIGLLGEEDVCEEHHDDVESTPEAGTNEHEHGACDPHVWTNPNNVKVWAQNIAEAFAAADTDNAGVYRANAEGYRTQLDALDAEVREILASVPEDKRVIVTNHEFLGYFGQHYGFEIVGVVIEGGTSLGEPDPQALAELVRVIRDEGVSAIFAEISANPQLAEVVGQEAGVTVVTTIYSDSLSAADGPAATYLDYLRYNAQTIAAALGG